MATIRRSRRLEQKATDAQEEAESATATQIAAETAAPAPTARKTTSGRKKTAAIGPKAEPADTVMAGPAAQSKTKKPKSARKTATTTATTTSAPKKVRATTKATTKAIETAAKEKEAKSKAKAVKKVKDESTTPKEEAKPRAKRAKNSKNDTSSRAEVGAEEMEPKVKTKRARGVMKEDGDTTTSTASAGRKKRKADPEDDGTDGNSEGSGTASLTQVGPITKKRKTMRGKKTGAAGAVEPPNAVVINRSDPYSVLPTELWQEVMSYLSLSQITKASSVSKSWLEGTQSLQVWRDICTNGSLGNPKKKYPTHMSLVCSQSYWVCERCLMMSNGKGSNIPLPVEIAELANEKRMLCRNCRCRYYKKHPEKIELRKNVMNHYGEYISERDVRITKTDACSMFHLTTEDLLSLSCVTKRNPHYRNAPPMKLYLERKVQKLSLEVHGGWIGIQAVSREVAKARRADAKERAQGLQTRVVQSTGKTKTEKNKDTSSTKGKVPMTQAAALATYDDDIQRWVKILQKPQRKALVVEAIAEAERRIAAGEPPQVIDYRSVTPGHEWIDTLRFALNTNASTREEIKKIVQYFEAGVYDALQLSCASSTEAAAGAEVGAMRLTEAGSSSSMAAVLPPVMDTTVTVA
ncbi:hypothetical protein KI688_006771 [Linnemannia hyalina]|uniref:F-box domain-containing protein n=1 Tax=Linnemannia hyalina TaxID=64524 RepID=A0A9P8BMT6_9FUNG|nr:hypothetical protein KI688_006771 [Linnemannia hyalina]